MSASCSPRSVPTSRATMLIGRCLRLIDPFIGDAGSHRCSMTVAAPASRYNERRPSCMSLRAAFATRPARGELRCGLPVGFVRGGGRCHPRAAHSPHRRFAFGYRPESACGSVSSAARSKPFVRRGRKKGLWLKLNCDNPTSSTKPRKQGCSMKHDPSIL
jgi:hypothetical protein